MERPPIYLDYHSTTPVDPVVLEAMIPFFSVGFGNPASRSHVFGWKAAEAVEVARRQVAALLSVSADHVYFTSGATEGLNLAIKGLAEARRSFGKHIVTVATEHRAVLDPLLWLEDHGFEVTTLPVQANGMAEPDRISRALRPDTIMVVVMWANNETGVIHPMEEIGRLCAEADIPLVSDITQAAGKIPVHLGESAVRVACLSSHKMYGPKGVGGIYIDPLVKRFNLPPLIHGGGHEGGYRSGTLNVPAIVGFGVAASLRMQRMKDDNERLGKWRDDFEASMLSRVEEIGINGYGVPRLPTVSNIRVRMIESQAVMSRFRPHLAISSGSACSSAHPEPSHVLLAMGLTDQEARGSFRISLGTPTTAKEMTTASDLLVEAIRAERSLNPVWQMFQQGVDLSGLV